jgi:uncharacterized delta-60 repeat protein
MNTKGLFLFLFYITFSFKLLAQISGANDLSFNPTDPGHHFGLGGNSIISSTLIQPDGKVILIGYLSLYNKKTVNKIVRVHTNGTIDDSFDMGAGFDNITFSIAIQNDGKLLVGGNFTTYNNIPRIGFVRINTDGSIDTSFNALISTGIVKTIAIQPDGKIIIGGTFTEIDGVNQNMIARLNTDGSLDSTFNVGIGFNGFVNCIKLLPDGKILVGGGFTHYKNIFASKLAKLEPNGNFFSGFSIPFSSDEILTIATEANGNVIAGGQMYKYIRRFYPNGQVDPSFTLGLCANNGVTSLAVQPDGKILVAGSFTQYNGVAVNRFVRLLTNGSIDPSMNTNVLANYVIYSINIQSDGKVILSGGFDNYKNYEANRVVRLLPDLEVDISFNIGANANNIIRKIQVLGNGKMIIGGDFKFYKGLNASYIEIINADGSVDTTFNQGTGFNNTVYDIKVQPDNKIIVVGSFTEYTGGSTAKRIMRLNPNGTTDAYSNSVNNSIFSCDLQNDGKVIFGGSFTIPGPRIARMNVDGSTDYSFDVGAGANDQVNVVKVLNNGKILVAGNFTNFAGVTCGRIVRLNSNNSLDTSFNSGQQGADGNINCVYILSNGKIIIGGNFLSYNGVLVNRLVRINSDGSIDSSFIVGSGANQVVNCVTEQADGKLIVAGDFDIFNGQNVNRILRLNVDGSIDNSFLASANGPVYDIQIDTSGKLMCGGDFTEFSGTGRNFLTRVHTTNCPSANSGVSIQNSCEPYTWIDGVTYIENNNTATYTLTNAQGCDSIVTLNLTINTSFSDDFITSCSAYTWIDGITYTSSTNSTFFTLTNTSGCDSIINLNLTITPPLTGTQNVISCTSFTWIDGITYSSSTNSSNFTIQNTAGCDSIVTLNLTITPALTGTQNVISCTPYTWIDGVTYSNSTNTPTFTLQNAAGCDSIVTLNLTIPAPTGIQNVISCIPYTWINGITYSGSTNTPTFTLQNALGCDSIVTLNLTITPAPIVIQNVTSCLPYTWIDGNTYSNSTNTPTFTLTNAAGCDSILNLSLTITPAITSTQNVTNCTPFTWIDGNTYTTSTNTPTFTFNNSQGCDSIVTLNLLIPQINVSVTQTISLLSADEIGASYQWLNCNNNYSIISNAQTQTFAPVSNGNYAVEILQNGCIDTSDCYNVIVTEILFNQSNVDFIVYPNPSNGIFNFKDTKNIKLVEVYNLLGEQILSQGNQKQINLSSFAKGIYYARINGEVVMKLVKE